ncbi:MAG: hypothetical protein ACRD7E_14885, partial [Bryobacteraceae bacterium]
AGAAAIQADTLHLRDGRTLNGTFESGDGREVRFRVDDEKSQVFPVSEVQSVEFDKSAGSEPNFGPERRGEARRRNRDASSTEARSSNARLAIPSGAVVTVWVFDAIDSSVTDVGKTYKASLAEPLEVGGRVVAAKGADATLQVVRVDESGRLAGSENVSLVLSELMIDGRSHKVTTSNAEVSSESKGKENIKVIGGTAALGAIIGAIAGGGRGAAIGAAAGAGTGAAIQAVRGQRVVIPSETELNFTLAEPVYME